MIAKVVTKVKLGEKRSDFEDLADLENLES